MVRGVFYLPLFANSYLAAALRLGKSVITGSLVTVCLSAADKMHQINSVLSESSFAVAEIELP